MGIWWLLEVCNILIPTIMLVAGYMMWKHCPKEINWVYGYRTSRSMKNMDTWRFAHEFCGRLWWRLGWILLIPSIVVLIPFIHSSEEVIGVVGFVVMIIQCIALIVSIFPTEIALKKNFDENGIRK